MFSEVLDLDEIEPLQRVRVLHVEKGSQGAIVAAYEDGRKEYGAPLRPIIRRTSLAPQTNGPRCPDAPPDGTRVEHKTHGLGVILRATAKMIRVRFDDGKERTIRPTSVEVVPPAP